MIIISSNTKIFLHAKMQSNYFFRKANPLIISSVLSVSMLECLRILSCLHKELSSLAQLGVLALLGFFESTGEEDGWSLELPLIRIFNSFVQTLCALHLTLLYLNISCSFHILRTGRSTVIAFVRQSTPAMQHNQSSSDFGPPYTEKAFLIHHIIFHMAYVFVSLFLFFSLTHLHFWSMLFCVAVDYCRLCTPDTHPRPPATGGDFRCGAYLQQMTSFPSLRLQVRHTYSMGLVINIQY